jgi:hypothetical protein
VLAVELVHELLISNPRESMAPVVPALVEQVLRPLVGNCTLRGLDFSSPGLGPREGHTYLARNQAILMPTNVAVTPIFKGKTECIDHVCARIKLHTRLDIMNTKISATRIKSYYKP